MQQPLLLLLHLWFSVPDPGDWWKICPLCMVDSSLASRADMLWTDVLL